MKIYNGIEVDRTSQEWKDLKTFFPQSSWADLALKIEIGFQKVFRDEKQVLSQDIWLCPVREIADSYGWTIESFCVRIFGRWTKGLAQSFGNLYFKGTGDCANCGGDMEFDEVGLVKCRNCNGVQEADTAPEQYYDPRTE